MIAPDSIERISRSEEIKEELLTKDDYNPPIEEKFENLNKIKVENPLESNFSS